MIRKLMRALLFLSNLLVVILLPLYNIYRVLIRNETGTWDILTLVAGCYLLASAIVRRTIDL